MPAAARPAWKAPSSPSAGCSRDGAWQSAPVLDRVKLPIGARITGPAVVQQIDATTLIEPGSAALVDDIGNLRIAVGLPA